MKRELTYDEVQGIIEQEDRCGVHNLIQEILVHVNKDNEVKIGKDIKVIAEINSLNQIEEVEVIKI